MQTPEQKAAWYAKNAERILAERKAEYANDPDIRARKKRVAGEHYRNNRERKKEQSRRSQLKKYDGLTPEDYDRMNQSQGGLCMLCKRLAAVADPRRKRLCVDHNHETNKVRDLLCGPCNSALGLFKENTAVLARAIDYLNQHSQGAPQSVPAEQSTRCNN